MAKVLITDTYLSDIARAIRNKLNVETTYTPAQMAGAIASIPESHVPVLQSKTATENGMVTPDSGYDGLSSVLVNVGSSDAGVVELFNFTESTSGQKNRASASTFGGVRQNSSGITFTTNNSYISVSNLCLYHNFIIEIDIAYMSLGNTGAYHKLIGFDDTSSGLVYSSGGLWQLKGPSATSNSELTSASEFNNCTLRIKIDAYGKWHIYKNGSLIWEPTVEYNQLGPNIYIGKSGNGIEGTIITGLRILLQ